MIAVGDKLPAGTLFKIGDAGPETIDAADYFGAGKVVLFSVPGAFTPTCSAKHLPGFIEKEAELKAKGVDKIACFAVNDPFVMKTWGEQQGADAKVDMLSDGNGEYTEALGLTMDGSKFGLGTR
ncbi:MAG: peroxiredoxin, partial [Rhodospirillaceae bacterium]